MALLDDVKLALRITPGNTSFDSEIKDLIDQAKADLSLSGVRPEKVEDEADPLIKRAITVYAKAAFGWNNPDADRLRQAYEMIREHLTLSLEYRVIG